MHEFQNFCTKIYLSFNSIFCELFEVPYTKSLLTSYEAGFITSFYNWETKAEDEVLRPRSQSWQPMEPAMDTCLKYVLLTSHLSGHGGGESLARKFGLFLWKSTDRQCGQKCWWQTEEGKIKK